MNWGSKGWSLKTHRQEPPGRDAKSKRPSDPDPKGRSDRTRSGPGKPERPKRDREPDKRRGGAPGTTKPKARQEGPRTTPRRGGGEPVPGVTLARPGRELLYGRNAVWEALRGRRRVERLYVA